AKILILGIPFVSKHFGSLPDSKNAPKSIREYFDYFYEYDDDHNHNIYDIPFYDVGDVKVKQKNYQKTKEIVLNVLRELKIINPNAKFIFLGGDHLITPMVVEALKPRNLVSLDAHLDLLENVKEYEHACAMRYVYETCKNITIQGYRDVLKSEIDFTLKNGIRISRDLNFRGIVDYLSIDVDVLDYIYATTSSPVAFGFRPEDVVKIIRRSEFKFADIVEWSPPHGFPAIVKIFRELLLRMNSLH
ncbi:MAG: arginase family protein, partial [Candidatus Aenigmarchaeota archaeon]|nr:arginase family protein [Candidatus Aenigmarchaeota archaeon]